MALSRLPGAREFSSTRPAALPVRSGGKRLRCVAADGGAGGALGSDTSPLGTLSPTGRTPVTSSTDAQTLDQIDHFVVIYQENWSFDSPVRSQFPRGQRYRQRA